MKLSNNLRLPQEFVAAVTENERTIDPKSFSVTELIQPTWISWLKRKYPDYVEDVSMKVSAALGTGFHLLMERQDTDGVHEYPAKHTFEDGRTLVGRIDRLSKDFLEITDYKTCKYAKIGRKDFDDWDRQGKCYAWLVWKSCAIKPRKFVVVALVTDYSITKAERELGRSEYAPVVRREIELTDADYDETEAWILSRMDAIDAKTHSPCTPEEKWAKPTIWAVKPKKSNVRALKLFSVKEEAERYVKDSGREDLDIEERRGENTRCLWWCPMSSFCLKEKEKINGKNSADSGRERSWEDSIPAELR